jgi:hypothetical protein
MMIVDIDDDDFAAMLRGEAHVRAGLTPAPGGLEEPGVLAHVRRLAANLRHSGHAGARHSGELR